MRQARLVSVSKDQEYRGKENSHLPTPPMRTTRHGGPRREVYSKGASTSASG